jgi:CheY-like chemotaxis protein
MSLRLFRTELLKGPPRTDPRTAVYPRSILVGGTAGWWNEIDHGTGEHASDEDRRARVLVVDDKPDIRRLLVTRLGLDPAFDVVGEAANGVEAIARVRELAPEVVVLDLQMPVMTGGEAIPIIRSLEPRTRIVVFSAYVGVQTQLEGSGRPDVEIAKGTDLKLLVSEIHRVLEAPLEDVVRVDLGELDVDEATEACSRWNQLSQQVRAATPGPVLTDLLALVGVFIAIGDRLAGAGREGRPTIDLNFSTRREAALAAHRALGALDDETSAMLDPLHGRLVAALSSAKALPDYSVTLP